MSLDGSADGTDETPVIRTAPMVAVVATCLLVYIPLTWPSQRETWMLIADTPPLTIHRILLIVGTVALWVSPMLGLGTTLHIAISAIKSISRIAVTSRRLQPSDAVDLPTTRRVGRGAGACGLAAAALSYPSEGTEPTAAAVALFIPVVIICFATTRPLVAQKDR